MLLVFGWLWLLYFLVSDLFLDAEHFLLQFNDVTHHFLECCLVVGHFFANIGTCSPCFQDVVGFDAVGRISSIIGAEDDGSVFVYGIDNSFIY